MDGYNIQRQGNWDYATKGETMYKRRINTTEWILVDRAPTERFQCLYLVRQRQGDGEPDHWSLFVAYENEPGLVYQVKGDAELMHYTHAKNFDIQKSRSFKDAFQLAYLTNSGAQWVEYYANSEHPPQAANRASVTENCQGWTVRVLERLAGKDIVTRKWVISVRAMLEAIR